jgi:hypothetical protein
MFGTSILDGPTILIGEAVKAADLGESDVSDRIGLTVGLDRRIDRIGRKCRRDGRGKPGHAAGGGSTSGDGAED